MKPINAQILMWGAQIKTPHIGPSRQISGLTPGPSQRKKLYAPDTVTRGEGKDEVMDCDWDYLLSGNPDDLLICDPSTEGEEGGDKLADGGAVYFFFLINKKHPVEWCGVARASW
jgi:hypothetical protein